MHPDSENVFKQFVRVLNSHFGDQLEGPEGYLTVRDGTYPSLRVSDSTKISPHFKTVGPSLYLEQKARQSRPRKQYPTIKTKTKELCSTVATCPTLLIPATLMW